MVIIYPSSDCGLTCTCWTSSGVFCESAKHTTVFIKPNFQRTGTQSNFKFTLLSFLHWLNIKEIHHEKSKQPFFFYFHPIRRETKSFCFKFWSMALLPSLILSFYKMNFSKITFSSTYPSRESVLTPYFARCISVLFEVVQIMSYRTFHLFTFLQALYRVFTWEKPPLQENHTK